MLQSFGCELSGNTRQILAFFIVIFAEIWMWGSLIDTSIVSTNSILEIYALFCDDHRKYVSLIPHILEASVKYARP